MGDVTPPVQPEVSAAEQIYIPSSVEKKRAVLMYLLLGIMGALGGPISPSQYERFHLKQAIGRWIIFLLAIIVSVIFMFIPYIRYLPLFLFLILIVILVICIKQANEGKYGRNPKSGLSLLPGIGEWMLALFEVKEEKK